MDYKIGSKGPKQTLLNKSLNHTITSLHYQDSNRKLTVASDSQGRGISAFLNQTSAGKFKVFNSCKPGALFETILESVRFSSEFETHSKSDCIVLIGGTNNVSTNSTTDAHSIPKKFKNYLANQLDHFKHTNLILSTIPYRYDQSAESTENKLVKDINEAIRDASYCRPHVQLLDLYLLQSWCHTKHGLHLNRKGKRRISKEIIRIAEDFVLSADHVLPSTKPTSKVVLENDVSALHAAKSLFMGDSSRMIADQLSSPVRVIEADMTEEIDKHMNSPHTALSHCISGDFCSQRQMSGGVAVAFRKKFGRPQRSDCINRYLTFQHRDNRAAVYGLITKQVFSGKPTLQDYNDAFHELTQDFHKRNFKVLICSAMGCVRDNISPQIFAMNIVKFHRITGATVNVVVTDERASRTLRNGLEYRKFVDLLRSCITRELSSTGDLRPVAADHRETLPELHPVTPLAADHRETPLPAP